MKTRVTLKYYMCYYRLRIYNSLNNNNDNNDNNDDNNNINNINKNAQKSLH